MSQTHSQKMLKRMPGRSIVASFKMFPMTTEESEEQGTRKTDPNGYYISLGLDPAKDWDAESIKKAYWVRAKKYHPDGSAPDEELFRRVHVAYEVLKDDESREKYDALGSSHQWIDEDVIAAIIKNVLNLKDRKEAVEALRKSLERPSKPVVLGEGMQVAPPSPTFSEFAYYYYEGEEVPDWEVRRKWANAVLQVIYHWPELHGMEVRLGFTTGPPHVVHKPWGNVLMASGDPNIQGASKLLDLILVHPPESRETG